MSNNYEPGNANQDVIELVFPDYDRGGARCGEFVEYSFNSHFMKPTDGWSFVLDSQAKATVNGREFFDAHPLMRGGARVELHLNGSVQATGFIDKVVVSASHSGGLI